MGVTDWAPTRRENVHSPTGPYVDGNFLSIGLGAEQYVGYIIDRKKSVDEVEQLTLQDVRRCAGHPASLHGDPRFEALAEKIIPARNFKGAADSK